jgi:hypothetical protein
VGCAQNGPAPTAHSLLCFHAGVSRASVRGGFADQRSGIDTAVGRTVPASSWPRMVGKIDGKGGNLSQSRRLGDGELGA